MTSRARYPHMAHQLFAKEPVDCAKAAGRSGRVAEHVKPTLYEHCSYQRSTERGDRRMTWFKVDDGLWGHPKWLATPAPARGLWVTAGSWSAANLTDGRIPRHVLPSLGGRPRDAATLVTVGLWVTAD